MPESMIEEKTTVVPAAPTKHRTEHKFDPEETVYVAEFKNNRDNVGYTKIENQYRFTPIKAVIERVIITIESGVKVVRYKIRGKAGSLYDEEDVCRTEEEAVLLCEEKNKA